MTEPAHEDIRLGRLQLQIMNVVWDRGEATVYDVKDVLGRGRKPAYSTILTMMRKLEQKGYLKHEERERTYHYQATITREQAERSLLGDLLRRLFDGSPSLLVNSLVEQQRVDEEELREIKRIINRRERRQ